MLQQQHRLVSRGVLRGRLLLLNVVAREERLGDGSGLLVDDLLLSEERPGHRLPVDENRARVRDMLDCSSCCCWDALRLTLLLCADCCTDCAFAARLQVVHHLDAVGEDEGDGREKTAAGWGGGRCELLLMMIHMMILFVRVLFNFNKKIGIRRLTIEFQTA